MMGLLLITQLWTSLLSMDPPNVLLHGTWSSCYDGEVWAEKVYEHHTPAGFDWTLHMGPMDEFGLYRYKDQPDPEDPEHRHEGPANFLLPRNRVTPEYSRANRAWTVPSLHLWVNIILQNGSRNQETNQCRTYVVLVRRQEK